MSETLIADEILNRGNHPLFYWDFNFQALNRTAYLLNKCEKSTAHAICEKLKEKMHDMVQGLDDDKLLDTAYVFADDLYKYVNDEVHASDMFYAYLKACARPLVDEVRERGYVIRYVAENVFSGIDFLMRGPFALFEKVFNTAGFVYICPQALAWRLMREDGLDKANYAKHIASYTAEARALADKLVTNRQENQQHYAFVEADYEEGTLDTARKDDEMFRALIIFRNEAPLPGTNVHVTFPKLRTEGEP